MRHWYQVCRGHVSASVIVSIAVWLEIVRTVGLCEQEPTCHCIMETCTTQREKYLSGRKCTDSLIIALISQRS